MFDNVRADFRAHGGSLGSQGFWAMVVYRFGRWRYAIRPPFLRLPFSMAYHILFKYIQIVTGIELPCEVRVGRNFTIDHFGANAVVIWDVPDNCSVTGVLGRVRPRKKSAATVQAPS